jgi:hypothetical protein
MCAVNRIQNRVCYPEESFGFVSPAAPVQKFYPLCTVDSLSEIKGSRSVNVSTRV